MKDYNFTKVSLMYDGVNSQLSDIDFYNTVRNAVRLTSGVLNYDVTLPAYFRSNPFITSASSYMAPVYKAYTSALSELLALLEKPMNWKGAVTPMMDTMKNSFIGRLNYPHPYFMERGAHAITLVTHGSGAKSDHTQE
jgi:hypothetical protein